MGKSALDWKYVYALMHRDSEAIFPPAALHYVLQHVRQHAQQARTDAGAASAPLTAERIITTFRAGVRADFGPLTREVLDEWNLRAPEDLGKAVLLLGRYRCLSLEPSDTLEAFAADAAPFTEGAST
jgi:uncharacterized repeat protein (TIGR04138 family)